MPDVTDRGPVEDRTRTRRHLDRWRRMERTMVLVRWGAAAFALVQVVTFYRPYPPRLLSLALGLVALLALGNLAVGLSMRRVHSLAGAGRLGTAALVLDATVVMGLVFVYTFDVDTAVWALIYLLPLEGALRFQLPGALVTMGAATPVYALREAFGTVAYNHEFLLQSISFRMGIGFLIAVVAGTMASNLVRDRDRLEVAKSAVEDYAAELTAANAELQRAAQVRDDFLAMTNHELRTPLTAVVGLASTLAERWDEVPEARRREFVESIGHQAGRLQGLVEDLLTLTSLQAGALALKTEAVEVVAAVDDAIRTTAGAADDVANACPPGLTMRADPQRLSQILTNYLSNALKYGAPPVRVEAAAGGGSVEVRVRDRGPGVDEDFAPRLFDKFSRADDRSVATVHGTGLGLAIVRLLAEAQSGRVWYEPDPDGGSAFCLSLPSEAEPGSVSRPAPDGRADVTAP